MIRPHKRTDKLYWREFEHALLGTEILPPSLPSFPWVRVALQLFPDLHE